MPLRAFGVYCAVIQKCMLSSCQGVRLMRRLASLPAQMKGEPAQKLELRIEPAVGTRPLILRRAFGTTRWRPAVQATSTSHPAEEVRPSP